MDELQISGKRFISSRRVAKENGYHTDYIGQLIRANKIKGQKVGRAWYVEAESFAKFLGEEPATAGQHSDSGYAVSSADETAEVLGSSASQPPTAEVAPSFNASIPPAAEVVPAPAVVVAPEPAPIVVHVQPGYIPSVPFTQAQTTVIAPAASTDSRYADLPADKSAEVASPSLGKPLTSVMPPAQTSAHSDEHSVPLRRVSTAPVGGLRYVTEEASLPEIPRSQAITRQMPKLEAEEEAVVTAHAPAAKVAVGAPRVWRKLAVVGVAAIAIFAISAVVSSGLFQTIKIQEGNPASVGYTLHW